MTERSNVKQSLPAGLEDRLSLFRSLMERSRDSILIADAETGRLIDANMEAARSLGYGMDELLEISVWDYVPSLAGEKGRELGLSWLEHVAVLEKEGGLTTEGYHKRKDGTLFPVESNVSIVKVGETKYILAIARDITGRKHAEEALQRSELSLKIAQEVSNMGSWEWDPATGKTIRSAQLYRIFGLTEKEFGEEHDTFDNFMELVHPDDRVNLQNEIGEALAEKRDYEITFRITRKDSNERIVNSQAKLIFDNAGNLAKIIGTTHDITEREEAHAERRRLEEQMQQSQKLESLGVLVSGISHDFNNLLHNIKGFAELLHSRAEVGSKEQKHLDIIVTAANRGRDLVKSILAFSRHSPGVKKPVSVKLLTDEALEMMRGSIPHTIKIEENADLDAGYVMADASQMHQVIMNLCINAVQAMPDGGTLTVRVERREEGGSCPCDAASKSVMPPSVRLSVSDTGPGIDESIRSRVFDPFFTTKSVDKGTGLGLSVVHGIVTGHGGYVSFESEPGAGTTFCVCLPAVMMDMDETDKAASKLESGRERVMFVDDETGTVEMVSESLDSIGYSVSGFNTPEQALDAFRESPDNYDIVITDLAMPGMNGVEFANGIKNVREDIPILLCTGYSSMVSPQEIEKADVAEVIMKPVSSMEISAAIRRALGG